MPVTSHVVLAELPSPTATVPATKELFPLVSLALKSAQAPPTVSVPTAATAARPATMFRNLTLLVNCMR